MLEHGICGLQAMEEAERGLAMGQSESMLNARRRDSAEDMQFVAPGAANAGVLHHVLALPCCLIRSSLCPFFDCLNMAHNVFGSLHCMQIMAS